MKAGEKNILCKYTAITLAFVIVLFSSFRERIFTNHGVPAPGGTPNRIAR